LFRRDGDLFWGTPKLARRGILNYWLPLTDPQGWRWLLHIGWTGLVISGAGALLKREGLDEVPYQIALAALAGALGAFVFHPRSMIFTAIIAVLGAVAAGFDGAWFAIPAFVIYGVVVDFCTKRDAAKAKATISDATSNAERAR
jgi:hypothetical protein